MIIDLHVHTNRLSVDSVLDPEEAIQQAKQRGLDGFCITEHNKLWQPEEIKRLRDKWNFLVLSGVEMDTVEGHILVFGLHEEIETFLRASELRQQVDEVGGVMIVAHPFKGFRVFGISQLGLMSFDSGSHVVEGFFHQAELVASIRLEPERRIIVVDFMNTTEHMAKRLAKRLPEHDPESQSAQQDRCQGRNDE